MHCCYECHELARAAGGQRQVGRKALPAGSHAAADAGAVLHIGQAQALVPLGRLPGGVKGADGVVLDELVAGAEDVGRHARTRQALPPGQIQRHPKPAPAPAAPLMHAANNSEHGCRCSTHICTSNDASAVLDWCSRFCCQVCIASFGGRSSSLGACGVPVDIRSHQEPAADGVWPVPLVCGEPHAVAHLRPLHVALEQA